MDYGKHDRLRTNLVEMLPKHFEGIKDGEGVARELLSHLSVSAAMEEMESNDKPPNKDFENLDKAARYIERASSSLRRVGLHGSVGMVEILQRVFPEMSRHGFGSAGSMQTARGILVDHLEKIQAELEKARDSIDLAGRSFNTAFGEGDEFEEFSGVGKQKKSTARFFALELAYVYYAESGKIPVVNTNPYDRGNPAYGAFFSFVSDAFEAVEISASPEFWARQACKDFSPKK
ncbi:hypothetical protein [uncultured Roseovarius sp.]|uniref:hypothetical protein n=1 Tax=uncultured Roseovarius sp. TaxID=293344 RepID=UPI0025FBA576|nr:hypothetical protein [uncultured Roseovarius sp.]